MSRSQVELNSGTERKQISWPSLLRDTFHSAKQAMRCSEVWVRSSKVRFSICFWQTVSPARGEPAILWISMHRVPQRSCRFYTLQHVHNQKDLKQLPMQSWSRKTACLHLWRPSVCITNVCICLLHVSWRQFSKFSLSLFLFYSLLFSILLYSSPSLNRWAKTPGLQSVNQCNLCGSENLCSVAASPVMSSFGFGAFKWMQSMNCQEHEDHELVN